MVLEPLHFRQTDQRTADLSHLSALVGDSWPWGFTSCRVDETALASSLLHVECEGVFPDGVPLPRTSVSHILAAGQAGEYLNCYVARSEEGGHVVIRIGEDAPTSNSLPVARLVFHDNVWSNLADWSPPALLIDAGHPMRNDLNQQLGALAALGAGFLATLRLPGAESRPAARVLGQVAAALVQGVGVLEALLAAPTVPPGRLGIEALRLTLGVRSAAGVFERLDTHWDPADQRGSLRRLLYAAEQAASGIGLPFRAAIFRAEEGSDILLVKGMPPDALLVAIEASRPADLLAARSWFEGAALAAPDRIQEALTRRVGGCSRHRVERDARIGISSGPLLALYHVGADMSWRSGQSDLALAAKTPPPMNTAFSVLLPEGVSGMPGDGPAPSSRGSRGIGLNKPFTSPLQRS